MLYAARTLALPTPEQTVPQQQRHVPDLHATTTISQPVVRPTLVTFSTWVLHAVEMVEPINSYQLLVSPWATPHPPPRTHAPVARTAEFLHAHPVIPKTVPAPPTSVSVPRRRIREAAARKTKHVAWPWSKACAFHRTVVYVHQAGGAFPTKILVPHKIPTTTVVVVGPAQTRALALVCKQVPWRVVQDHANICQTAAHVVATAQRHCATTQMF